MLLYEVDGVVMKMDGEMMMIDGKVVNEVMMK